MKNEIKRQVHNIFINDLQRQIRIQGSVTLVDNQTADEYYNSRAYESRIGAWASTQSEVMQTRDEFEKKVEEFKKKYPDPNNVPRGNG